MEQEKLNTELASPSLLGVRQPKCPVCYKTAYWEKPSRNGQRYNQCQNCLSIINMDMLAARRKKAA